MKMQGKDFSHPLEMTTPVISNEQEIFLHSIFKGGGAKDTNVS
jgi:hypothetical protein